MNGSEDIEILLENPNSTIASQLPTKMVRVQEQYYSLLFSVYQTRVNQFTGAVPIIMSPSFTLLTLEPRNGRYYPCDPTVTQRNR